MADDKDPRAITALAVTKNLFQGGAVFKVAS